MTMAKTPKSWGLSRRASTTTDRNCSATFTAWAAPVTAAPGPVTHAWPAHSGRLAQAAFAGLAPAV